MRSNFPLLAILIGCSGPDKGAPLETGVSDGDDTGGSGFEDADGDGASAEEDCDDADAAVHPGAEELCDEVDNDCDGEVDEGASEGAWYPDADRDGYGDDAAEAGLFCDDPGDDYATEQGDCDDGDDAVYPGAEEVCDEVDNDCDGLIDALDDDLSDGFIGYEDADGDGYGDPDASYVACSLDDHGVTIAGDCDDSDGDYNPGAGEDDCTDPNDYNCDGVVAFADDDGDGFAACVECDDGDATVNPDATEICDEIDNDCDGEADEADAVGAEEVFADADGDGYGDVDSAVTSCEAPADYVADDTDCDDTDDEIHPGATEVCDGADNDCDELTDDADDDVDLSTGTAWSYDYDDDGYGGDADVVTACEAPTSRYLAESGDCDDEDAAYNPGAEEGCDGEDYDCDGLVDNDADEDGYADLACGGDDCDDADAAVYPSETGECPLGQSCADILDKFPDMTSGTYSIDIDGYATGEDPFDVSCDMETDGGGWTEVLHFDAESDGDGTAELEALMVEEYNNMSIWGDKTGYIRWADNNATADVLSYRYDVEVPNSGDALFIYKFYGYSMEDSGTFFYVTSDSEPTNLACHDNFTPSSYYTKYSATERAYDPDYSCEFTDYGATFTWDEETVASASGEIDSFYLRAFMYDTYGDYAYLYRMSLWVR